MYRTGNPRAVLLLSGGLDSSMAGAIARGEGFELFALTIRYGQVHEREVAAARHVARALGVARHIELDVNLAAFGGSARFAAETERLTPLADAGLLVRNGDRLVMTPEGRPYVRIAAAAFDAWLTAGEKRHSVAV